jgi:hypothetical protein
LYAEGWGKYQCDGQGMVTFGQISDMGVFGWISQQGQIGHMGQLGQKGTVRSDGLDTLIDFWLLKKNKKKYKFHVLLYTVCKECRLHLDHVFFNIPHSKIEPR